MKKASMKTIGLITATLVIVPTLWEIFSKWVFGIPRPG